MAGRRGSQGRQTRNIQGELARIEYVDIALHHHLAGIGHAGSQNGESAALLSQVPGQAKSGARTGAGNRGRVVETGRALISWLPIGPIAAIDDCENKSTSGSPAAAHQLHTFQLGNMPKSSLHTPQPAPIAVIVQQMISASRQILPVEQVDSLFVIYQTLGSTQASRKTLGLSASSSEKSNVRIDPRGKLMWGSGVRRIGGPCRMAALPGQLPIRGVLPRNHNNFSPILATPDSNIHLERLHWHLALALALAGKSARRHYVYAERTDGSRNESQAGSSSSTTPVQV
ncbi:hypothetical protein V8F20_005748 [Naviculisporaceae sp. PSN 640]